MRTAFREKLAKSIEKRYLRIVDEPLYIKHGDVVNFINTGMELRIAETCGFVPVDEYRPAPRKEERAEPDEVRAIVPREPPAPPPARRPGGSPQRRSRP